MDASPHELATKVVFELEASDRKIVFAESCTGGMVAATMASVPGVSQWLCGSAVTYRERSKVDWLGVPPEVIDTHSAVSQQASSKMAETILEKTSEAALSAAITGHLGPHAPTDLDGVCFLAVAIKDPAKGVIIKKRKVELSETSRIQRQREATGAVLAYVLEVLS